MERGATHSLEIPIILALPPINLSLSPGAHALRPLYIFAFAFIFVAVQVILHAITSHISPFIPPLTVGNLELIIVVV